MANTSYKIVDYLATNPANQYDFTFPSGWEPLNEQQSPIVNLERDAYPFVNLTYFTHYGVSEKIITLQGRDIADNDRYKLSAAIANPRVKKLYLGEDWYYYVIGLEPRSIRDESLPLTYNYTASFLCVDPCMYYDGTGSGDYPDGTAGFGYEENSGSNFWIDLRTSNYSNAGSWFVEPIIWISGENDEGTITDPDGRVLTWTPPSTDTWVILPYFNSYPNGFYPDYPIAFKWRGGDSALEDYDEFFALDETIYSSSPSLYKGTSGTEYSMSMSLSMSSSSHPKYPNKYPRIEFGDYGNLVVGGNWSATNIKVQWRYRRI